MRWDWLRMSAIVTTSGLLLSYHDTGYYMMLVCKDEIVGKLLLSVLGRIAG